MVWLLLVPGIALVPSLVCIIYFIISFIYSEAEPAPESAVPVRGQSRMARPKPRLGQYKLDIDSDSDGENTFAMPSLIEPDMDDEKPIQMPVTK